MHRSRFNNRLDESNYRRNNQLDASSTLALIPLLVFLSALFSPNISLTDLVLVHPICARSLTVMTNLLFTGAISK